MPRVFLWGEDHLDSTMARNRTTFLVNFLLCLGRAVIGFGMLCFVGFGGGGLLGLGSFHSEAYLALPVSNGEGVLHYNPRGHGAQNPLG